MYIVYETLRNLGVEDKTVITAFNKQDREGAETILRDFKADYTVRISAKTGFGLEELLETIEDVYKRQRFMIALLWMEKNIHPLPPLHRICSV